LYKEKSLNMRRVEDEEEDKGVMKEEESKVK
jgi:hypothetical protein